MTPPARRIFDRGTDLAPERSWLLADTGESISLGSGGWLIKLSNRELRARATKLQDIVEVGFGSVLGEDPVG